MFKKNSPLIQKHTHFIWQEKYFCLLREEGHSTNYTTQERNGLRQNYSSSVNVSPSLKSRYSCTILNFLVTPASHDFLLRAPNWTLCSNRDSQCNTRANSDDFWVLGFFCTSEEMIWNLQTVSSELHWVTLPWSFSPEIRKLLPFVLCWWPELLWGVREIKTALKWIFSILDSTAKA